MSANKDLEELLLAIEQLRPRIRLLIALMKKRSAASGEASPESMPTPPPTKH